MKIKFKGNQRSNDEFSNLDRKWKEENTEYLEELQRFFDKVDRIEDSELRASIISQMLICDSVLTKIAENMFINFYDRGYKKAKQE